MYIVQYIINKLETKRIEYITKKSKVIKLINKKLKR